MDETSRRRVVAIVGRPNVGKSALFNRLVGRRLAIVHGQSGTTRDRLVAEAVWGDQRFEAVDTGGIVNMDKASLRSAIDVGIRTQVDSALQDAAAAILVVDVQSGMMPLDSHVADLLRALGLRVFVAANKADNAEMDVQCSEFERLGFPVFPVAAIHGRGIDPLLSAVIGVLPTVENQTIAKPLKVAVVGRPNVGKSSYINRLLRDERVIVSEVPGTTRDSVEIPFVVGSGPQARRYALIDTAGMRTKGRTDGSLEWFSLLRTQKTIARADVVVVVADAAQGITAQDKHIIGDALEQGKGCAVLVNKWDLSKVTETQYAAELRYSLSSMSFVPVVCVSAKSGYNIRRSVDLVDHVAAQVRSELSTGVLNRVISSACERQAPPMVKGRRLSVFYAVQTGTQPVTIRIFVNDPVRMRPTYGSYLIGALRAAFGLDGAPVVLDLKARTQGRENDRGLERSGGAGGDEHGSRESRTHEDTSPARRRKQ